MDNFLNALPNWMLAILALLFFLIALLYVWILLNWLDLRQRVYQLQARVGPLEAERAEWLAPREQVTAPPAPDDALRMALGEFRSKAAYATRAAELKQAALDDALERISVFEQRDATLGN